MSLLAHGARTKLRQKGNEIQITWVFPDALTAEVFAQEIADHLSLRGRVTLALHNAVEVEVERERS